MNRLRIGIIQMRCEKGAIAENLREIEVALSRAEALGVQIVGFPEMSLTGYISPVQCPQAVLSMDGPEIAALLEISLSYPVTALVGIVEANPEGKPFITQLVVRQGRRLGFYRKRTIEDEEAELFSPGVSSPVFQHGGLTFGLAICADVGNREVFADAAQQGARVVFELAAPGLYGDQATRNWESGYRWWEGLCLNQLAAHARELGVWIPVATQAGRTVDEDFPGGGYVFAPGGNRLYATQDGRPGTVFLELDLASRSVLVLEEPPFVS